MKDKSVIVKCGGFDFEVTGTWIGAESATATDPGHGGYFDEYDISLDGVVITDLLNDSALEEIMGDAEESVRRQ